MYKGKLMKLITLIMLFSSLSAIAKSNQGTVTHFKPLSFELVVDENSPKSILIPFNREFTLQGHCLIGNNLVQNPYSGSYYYNPCQMYDYKKFEDMENITINMRNSSGRKLMQPQKLLITISLHKYLSDQYDVDVKIIDGPEDMIKKGKNFYLNPKFTLIASEKMDQSVVDEEIELKSDLENENTKQENINRSIAIEVK